MKRYSYSSFKAHTNILNKKHAHKRSLIHKLPMKYHHRKLLHKHSLKHSFMKEEGFYKKHISVIDNIIRYRYRDISVIDNIIQLNPNYYINYNK